MTLSKINVQLKKDINELIEFIDLYGNFPMEIDDSFSQHIGVDLFLDVYEYDKILKSLKSQEYEIYEE